MKYTDDDISKRLSLDLLEPEAADAMLASFYKTLDMRVMLVVADRMSDEQLAAFDALKDSDKEDANKMISELVPDYDALMDEEADKLLQEIDDNAAATQ